MSGEAFGVRKIGYTVPISREMALDYGLVQPTDAERIEREQARAEWDAKREAARPVLVNACRALDAITDPLARRLLDLHQRVSDSYRRWHCEGCDAEGYEWEYPSWPCSTTGAISAHYGIDIPEIVERPDDGSLDVGRTP